MYKNEFAERLFREMYPGPQHDAHVTAYRIYRMGRKMMNAYGQNEKADRLASLNHYMVADRFRFPHARFF